MNTAAPTQPRPGAGRALGNPRRADLTIRVHALTALFSLTLGGLALTVSGCGGGPKSDPLTPAGACLPSAAPTSAPPYAVDFQFRNDTAASVFLLQSCGTYQFGVSSCASGFADHLNDFVACACTCDTPRCGIVCGPCALDEATELVAGDSLRRPFTGVATTSMASVAGMCVTSRVLPAGRYRVSIDVYDSSAAALGHAGPRVVTHDFELPAPSGLVDVPLGP